MDYPALVPPGLPTIEDEVAVTFRDLMELRFINKLRELRIGWKEIKLTVDTARELYDTPRPFGTKRFAADGKKVFARIAKSGILMRANQLFLGDMLEPSLTAELEYEGDEIARWRPEIGANFVVIDPSRSLGKPILDEFDVPTVVLAAAAFAEESVQVVADWFDIPVPAVRAAVEFEKKLLAA